MKITDKHDFTKIFSTKPLSQKVLKLGYRLRCVQTRSAIYHTCCSF